MSGKKRRPGWIVDSLFQSSGTQSGLRQTRNSRNKQELDPLEQAREIQSPNDARHRRRRNNSPPQNIASPFRTMRDNEVASDKKQNSRTINLCDGDSDTEISTMAVTSPTPMTSDTRKMAGRSKIGPHKKIRENTGERIPPYHPSSKYSARNRSREENQITSSNRKRSSLRNDETGSDEKMQLSKSRVKQKTSLVSSETHAEDFRNEMEANCWWNKPMIIPKLKETIPRKKKKKCNEDVKDMDDGCHDKSDDSKPPQWTLAMKNVVVQASANESVPAATSTRRSSGVGLAIPKVNNKIGRANTRSKKRPKGKPINAPGSTFSPASDQRQGATAFERRQREQPWRSEKDQDEYHTTNKAEQADTGMGWDPLSGRNFQTGNVPRNKQFGKRKQEDDVLDSPAPRRSKRTKKKAKTNDVIDICSDSEDENIVITESETAIPEKEEECDVTKFHLKRLAIDEKVYKKHDHRPKIVFKDAELEMDIVYHCKANSFDNDPERIRITLPNIHDFAYWGRENAVVQPPNIDSLIYMQCEIITNTISRRNRNRSNNKTIILEFEKEEEMNDLVELVDGNIRTASIPPDDIEGNAAVLIKDSKRSRKSRSRKEKDPFVADKKSDEILLVYPFEGDKNSLDAAANGLLELGWQESLVAKADLVESKGDIKLGPSPSSTSTTDNGSSENALTTTQNGQRTHFIEIRVEDYEKLDTGEWLNDSLVDMWMQWISRHIACKQSSNVHFFTSHFYTTLASEGAEGVRSWTAKKNINIFEKRLIFIPINKTDHWSLCVVVNPGAIIPQVEDEDPLLPCILFFDSLNMHRKQKVRTDVSKWLNAEWWRTKDKDAGRIFNKNSFKLYDPKVPRQNNFSDCGVFVCRYALAMFQLRHKRFTRRDAGLEQLVGDSPIATRRTQRATPSGPFVNLITNGHAFDFDVEDIQRIRQDFKTLIRNLHPLYKAAKLVKIEAEKERKRARKKIKTEATRALELERSMKEPSTAAKSSSENGGSKDETPTEMSDSSSKENYVPRDKTTTQKPNAEATLQEEARDLSTSEGVKQRLPESDQDEEIYNESENCLNI